MAKQSKAAQSQVANPEVADPSAQALELIVKGAIAGIDLVAVQSVFNARSDTYLALYDYNQAVQAAEKEVAQIDEVMSKLGAPTALGRFFQNLVDRATPTRQSVPKPDLDKCYPVSLPLLMVHQPGRSELVVPWSVRNPATTLQQDLSVHIQDAISTRQLQDQIEVETNLGSNLKYTVIHLKPGNYAPMVRAIRDVPETVREIGITSDVLEMKIEHYMAPESEAQVQTTQSNRRVYIQLTPGAIRRAYIPVRSSMEDLFPGYRKNFTLESQTYGPQNVWMTSRPDGSNVQGNYLVGQIGRLYKEAQAKPDEFVVLEIVQPKKMMRFIGTVIVPPMSVIPKDISYSENGKASIGK